MTELMDNNVSEDDAPPESMLQVTWHGQSPAELLTTAGEWLERQNDGPDPSVYYRAALAVDPTFSLAAYRMGQWELQRQRAAEAVDALELAMRLTPEHAPTFHLASKAYAGLNDWTNALRCAEGALARNPLNAAAFLQRLRSLAALERWQEIEGAAPPFDPMEAPEILLWRALAAVHLGNVEDARNAYDRLPAGARRRHRELTHRIERLLDSR